MKKVWHLFALGVAAVHVTACEELLVGSLLAASGADVDYDYDGGGHGGGRGSDCVKDAPSNPGTAEAEREIATYCDER